MSTEVFINYADYYAYAADMHRKVSTSFSEDLEARLLDLDDFLINNDLQGDDFTKDLVVKIAPLRKNLLMNFSQISYLEASFNELSKYVQKKFGRNVDDMLTTYGLKVYRSYAQVANSLAQSISESNIKEE